MIKSYIRNGCVYEAIQLTRNNMDTCIGFIGFMNIGEYTSTFTDDRIFIEFVSVYGDRTAMEGDYLFKASGYGGWAMPQSCTEEEFTKEFRPAMGT